MAHQNRCKYHGKVNGSIFEVNIDNAIMVDLNKSLKNMFKSIQRESDNLRRPQTSRFGL